MKKMNIKFIKKQVQRLLFSMLLAALLCVAMPKQFFQNPPAMAWWGSLYPKFCFGEDWREFNLDSDETHPKISFYLAKLLDW